MNASQLAELLKGKTITDVFLAPLSEKYSDEEDLAEALQLTTSDGEVITISGYDLDYGEYPVILVNQEVLSRDVKPKTLKVLGSTLDLARIDLDLTPADPDIYF